MQSDTEHGDGQDLVGGDAEDLAEEQREDLGLVLGRLAQEKCAEREHDDEAERGRDVVAPAATERCRSRAQQHREDAEAEQSVFTPIRLAPAAPAKAPFGIACAGNAEPRSTTKKPTTPAITATIVATIHALTMKAENIV